MAATRPGNSLSILMVEDDDTARRLTVQMIALKFPEATIFPAENGREGLRAFSLHRPDLVVTDINMPEMDGMEMARAIKAIDGAIPVIVLTAYGDDAILRSFTDIGYCRYLRKPILFQELFDAIQSCRPGAVDCRIR